MPQRAIACTVLRGGTSKGLYFLDRDLPGEPGKRDAVLLAAMGSPDPRQIDGMGGADSLTSKVAIVGRSSRADADIDYLFLQVSVAEARVDGSQNCGNILAGVVPFAIESGLVAAGDPTTTLRVHMVNTGSIAAITVRTPGGEVAYGGEARIDGVPGTAAPVLIDFLDVAGSSCGALLPTGRVVDMIEGVAVTLIDNGMPVVLMRAADLGVSGREPPEELEANQALVARVEAIRLIAGPMMNLGDVAKRSVPKMCLLSPPAAGGTVGTRNFIPHKVHKAIGVLGAVSVATACLLPGSTAQGIAALPRPDGGGEVLLDIEHPTGSFAVSMLVRTGPGGLQIGRSALLRTARKLMSGEVFVPAALYAEG